MRLPAFLFPARRRAEAEQRRRALAADIDARLATRKVGRPTRREWALRSARTRHRHDIARDPLLAEMVQL